MTRPIDDLLTYAERAYVRMEAEQLIRQCLEEGDSASLDQLIQGLVLAGASSLGIMREILAEIRSTRSSLVTAGLEVRQDLINALGEFGVKLSRLLPADAPEMFRQICSPKLRKRVRLAARGLSAEDEALLQEVCEDAGQRVESIARRLAMLGRLEDSIEDWFYCLAYEATRHADTFGQPPYNAPVQ
jgi:hypothetical protein